MTNAGYLPNGMYYWVKNGRVFTHGCRGAIDVTDTWPQTVVMRILASVGK